MNLTEFLKFGLIKVTTKRFYNIFIMNDISDILRTLLDQLSIASKVDAEFANMLECDDTLKGDYEEWCEANGYDLKTGYKDYIDELIDSRDSIWENLNE